MHGVSITTLILVAVGSTSLLLSALGLTLFARRPTALYGWFTGWMAAVVVYSVVRIAQMTGATDPSPAIAARIVVATTLVAALATMRFACAFVERPIAKLETIVSVAFVAVVLGLVAFTDLVVTHEPVRRTVGFGESFVGAAAGPAFPVFLVGTRGFGVAGIVRMILSRAWTRPSGALLLGSYVFGFSLFTVDTVVILLGIDGIRLSDLGSLPLAWAYASSEATRFAHLLSGLESEVEARTRDLAAANVALRREHEEREGLQHRLATTDRLESLGRMASGVAHDFNHLLSIVGTNNELVARAVPAEGKAQIATRNIDDTVVRATELVRQLLAFAREQPVEPKRVEVGPHLARMQSLFASLVGSRIRITVEARGVSTVLIDPSQLEQIVVNLVVNARDAIQDGGSIDVSVDRLSGPPATIEPMSGDTSHGVVRLRVRDTGEGIPAELFERIFEPFFTTKGPGKGTGLGLATVFGATQQAGGVVTVASEVGFGTTFDVYLPSSPEERDA